MYEIQIVSVPRVVFIDKFRCICSWLWQESENKHSILSYMYMYLEMILVEVTLPTIIFSMFKITSEPKGSLVPTSLGPAIHCAIGQVHWN